jgi:hypothetical protein
MCIVFSASTRQAGLLVSTGLAKKGYVYLNMDDTWANRTRNGSGALVPDPTKFPTPMAELVNHVHSLGLKFGIYTDVGTRTCGKRPGSFGHETADAELFVRQPIYLCFVVLCGATIQMHCVFKVILSAWCSQRIVFSTKCSQRCVLCIVKFCVVFSAL